jgi:hypothetical protein
MEVDSPPDWMSLKPVAKQWVANLFLHYAFDRWMAKQYPQMPFERYADDGAPRAQRAEEGPMCVTA